MVEITRDKVHQKLGANMWVDYYALMNCYVWIAGNLLFSSYIHGVWRFINTDTAIGKSWSLYYIVWLCSTSSCISCRLLGIKMYFQLWHSFSTVQTVSCSNRQGFCSKLATFRLIFLKTNVDLGYLFCKCLKIAYMLEEEVLELLSNLLLFDVHLWWFLQTVFPTRGMVFVRMFRVN